MTALQAKAAFLLWETGHFDTSEIASVIRIHESVVVRTLRASRDVVRDLYQRRAAE